VCVCHSHKLLQELVTDFVGGAVFQRETRIVAECISVRL
jgi:hypothetical protein